MAYKKGFYFFKSGLAVTGLKETKTQKLREKSKEPLFLAVRMRKT